MGKMLVVERELVLDLTEKDEENSYAALLKESIDTVLTKEIHEFTLVSTLTRKFRITDLTQILKQTTRLEVLSLFSVALSGTVKDCAEFGKVLRRHQGLKEVHMVDCGMLGNWAAAGENESLSTKDSTNSKFSRPSQLVGKATQIAKASIATKVSASTAKPSDASKATASTKPSDSTKTTASTGTKPLDLDSSRASKGDSKTESRGHSKTSTTKGSSKGAFTMTPSVSAASSGSSMIAPTLDVILNSLAKIETLENVELYGVPTDKFSTSSDGDQESGHQAIQEEGEGDQDIPMVPMGDRDSANFSDDDYMADYAEDIRGIPGHGRKKCGTAERLSLLMSPESMGALCRGKNLSNLGMEDIRLTEKHIEFLAEAFSAEDHKIKELKLYGCNIDDKGALALAKMLKVNKTLEKLDLSYNRIDDEGCIAIAAALRGNQKLATLNLVGNECADNYDAASSGGCYEALLDLLDKNKTLKDLILEAADQDDNSDCVPEFIIIPSKEDLPDDVSSASYDEED